MNKKIVSFGILSIVIILALFKYINSDAFVKNKYKIYSYLSKNYIATEILNFKMFLQPGDEIITPYMLAYHHWEPLETQLNFNSLKEGDIFVDVGANIGYYTILASKKVGLKGHVYSFEPEPNNFNLLKLNVVLNELTNVTIFEKAVADRTGRMTLYLNKKNKGDHTLRKDIEDKESITVDVVKIDEFLKNKKIDVIKIDVQGADGLVINGAMESISKNKNLIIFTEFNPHSFRNLGIDPMDILNRLKSLGYKFENIDEKKGEVESMSISKIMDKFDKLGVETNLMISKK